MTNQYLVIVDADRIHDYVFSPHQLKLIRGASAVQARLNESELTAGLARFASAEQIYAGGGTVMALFPDCNSARAYSEWAERKYFETTWAATATGVWHPCVDFQNDLKTARLLLERKKTARSQPMFNGGTPYWKICEACGLSSVSVRSVDQFLCRACAIRLENAAKSPYLDKVSGRCGLSLAAPPHFEALGQLSKPPNYLAMVYLDVNRLGEHLHGKRSSHPSMYREASQRVKSAVENGVIDGCTAACTENTTTAPFEILLVGGDDAIVMLAAHHVFKFLEAFHCTFKKAVKDTEDAVLTVSGAIVWGHSTYPVAEYMAKAEVLLKSAKRNGGFALDFMVVTEAMAGEPDRTTLPTARPYAWDELLSLGRTVMKWKTARFPANKVRSMYPIAHQERYQAQLDYWFLLSRLEPGQRDEIRKVIGADLFEGRSRKTKAADAVELWDFVEPE